MISDCRSATGQHRCWARLRRHLLAQLVCLGRHTLTAVKATSGEAFSDWSSDYRLYSRERFDPDAVFGVVRRCIHQRLDAEAPFVVAMDDSMLRKTGRKIHGVAYRRDPLSPPFQANLVLGQRVLQVSAALTGTTPAALRMVPIDFVHIPTPAKPSKHADAAQWAAYRQAADRSRINRHGLERITELRRKLDQDGAGPRPLWVTVDGRFTNRNVMRTLPARTIFIGRIRADAVLYHLPEPSAPGRGRKRIYGAPAPTPEQLRQSDAVPWQSVAGWACGRPHAFRVKRLRPLRWRATSDQVNVQIVVIAPLGYRLSKPGRVLYRQPAYLVCTDPDLPLEKILQAYLQRWDIEVNFRDDKTLLGVGQAQVRVPASTASVPALAVAAYSLLLLAAHAAFPGSSGCLPAPKWRRRRPEQRAALSDLIALLRHDLWADAIRLPRLSHFTAQPPPTMKSEKSRAALAGALFYAPA